MNQLLWPDVLYPNNVNQPARAAASLIAAGRLRGLSALQVMLTDRNRYLDPI